MKFESKESLAAYFSENPVLIRLEIEDSPGLTSLPELPRSMSALLVSNCPRITSLPALPSTLIYLRAAGCGLRAENCPGLMSCGGLKIGKLTIEIV